MRKIGEFISVNARGVILFVVLLGVALVLSSCGEDGSDTPKAERPKCNKACQRANDVYVDPEKGYTDYFVNDSDGKKDSVFSVYHNVPFPTAGEGVKCDVVKMFEAEGISGFAVCPDRAVAIAGSSAQSNNDEDSE